MLLVSTLAVLQKVIRAVLGNRNQKACGNAHRGIASRA
jgi:hypothetical protein